MEGWIKLHRKLLDSPMYRNEAVFRVWIFLLLSANQQDRRILWNGKERIVRSGQLITGQLRIMEKTGLTRQTVRTVISTLKSTNAITVESTNKFSIISIVNWQDYQHQVTSKKTNNKPTKQPASNQPVTTNKNGKNERNNTEEVLKKFNEAFKKNYRSPVSIERNLDYWLQHYSLTDVFQAITAAAKDEYWKKIITPEMLLRKKNPRGEDVDYIGKFLNSTSTTKRSFYEDYQKI